MITSKDSRYLLKSNKRILITKLTEKKIKIGTKTIPGSELIGLDLNKRYYIDDGKIVNMRDEDKVESLYKPTANLHEFTLQKRIDKKMQKHYPSLIILPLNFTNVIEYFEEQKNFRKEMQPNVVHNIMLKANVNSASNILLYDDYSKMLLVNIIEIIKNGTGKITEAMYCIKKSFHNDIWKLLYGKNQLESKHEKVLFEANSKSNVEDICSESEEKDAKRAKVHKSLAETCDQFDSAIFASSKLLPDTKVISQLFEKLASGSPFVLYTPFHENAKLMVEHLKDEHCAYIESIEELCVREMNVLEGRVRPAYLPQSSLFGGFVILCYKIC